MVRMSNSFAAIIVVAIFFVSGCATSGKMVKMDEATAAKLKAEVAVYDSKKLSGLEYKTVRQIQATACGNKEDGINQLRSVARSAGANGIMKIKCDRMLGPTLMQNCVTTTICEAVAITVGKEDVVEVKKTEEPSRVEERSRKEEPSKDKMMMPKGEERAQVKSETSGMTSAPTLGQELIDLRKAYEMGAISEKEYNDTKQKLIEKKIGK